MAVNKSLKPIPGRLQDNVVVITGGAGNIGVVTAQRFLLEGAKVVLIDLNEAQLEAAKTALSAGCKSSVSCPQDRILAIKADVTDELQMEMALKQTVAVFGGLDTCFLNAGISYQATPLLDTSVELFDRCMNVNTKSAFIGLKHAGRIMRDCGKGQGSIIFASSVAGLIARPGMTAYGCSKQALRSLAMYGAAELGQYGIRVNTVHPCGVNSPMFLECWPEHKIKEMLAALPLGRLAEADDIAAMVTFLASADAQFLTGGAFKVDGGQANY